MENNGGKSELDLTHITNITEPLKGSSTVVSTEPENPGFPVTWSCLSRGLSWWNVEPWKVPCVQGCVHKLSLTYAISLPNSVTL